MTTTTTIDLNTARNLLGLSQDQHEPQELTSPFETASRESEPEIEATEDHRKLMDLAEKTEVDLPDANERSPETFYAFASLEESDPVAEQGEVSKVTRYRSKPEIEELVSEGHGFIVQTLGSKREAPPPCPYCGGPLYSATSWLCELTMTVVTLRTDAKCECNWCLINREALQGPGRPRAHCGKSDCQKSYRRLKNREAYRRRKEQLVFAA